MDIGAQLREAREVRGLTIAAISGTTRVPARVLEAIELNAREALPARPYARGFVAAFAREVGLNPDQIVHDYFAQFEEPAAPADPAPAEPPPRVRWQIWVPGFGILALAIALGAFVMRRAESPPQQVRTTAVGTSGTATSAPPSTLPAPARTPAEPGIAATSAPGAGVIVTIETRKPTWIAATADGKRQLYELVPAGTTNTIRASREIVLRVGDAGGVSWSVNGRPPAVMGRPGEVREVRLTPGAAATMR